MKTLKRIFYGLCICILLVCIVILAFAMNPDWSDKLSAMLYGEDSERIEELSTPAPTQTPEEEDTLLGEATPTPQLTPMAWHTHEPGRNENGEEIIQNPPKDQVVLNSVTIKSVVPTVQNSSYVEPFSDSVTVPEAVSAWCGYVPITVEAQEITDAEAKTLSESLTEGDTGELLVFDQNYYPYYHMLQDSEKELYRQIYANAFAKNERFKPCEEIYSTQIGRVMEAVFNDHPILFWIDTAYGCKYDSKGKCVEITLKFNSAAVKLEQSKTTFNEKAEAILSVARTLGSDYEKEKYVHDKLLSKVSYSADAEMNQSAYSALVNGQTVCAGYARAFQYLMQQLGIPCYYCTGVSGENHAWNIIRLYGEYYNVDTTWDDTTPYTYDYFNRTDAEFGTTHVRKGLSVKLPACNGTLYGGLEGSSAETDVEQETPAESSGYSALVEQYYDTLIERIESMGRGSASYKDVLAVDTWNELERAYANGNVDLKDAALARALNSVGAQYCIISLSPEVNTENAYNVTCSITVR